MTTQTELLKLTLEKIATVNAMDYEYQAWAREALAVDKESLTTDAQPDYAITQTGVGIGQRAKEAYEAAKERGWEGLSDHCLMENAQGELKQIKLVQTGVGIDKPEQKPVAWMDEFGNVFPLGAQRGPKHLNEPMKPLYTSPPAAQRQPLTDEQIKEINAQVSQIPPIDYTTTTYARAIKAKLKEKNT